MRSFLSWRAAAGIAGCGILGAATHTNVASGPGYGSAQSTLMLAVAAGVAASALATGAMWQAKRRALALGLMLAAAAGRRRGGRGGKGRPRGARRRHRRGAGRRRTLGRAPPWPRASVSRRGCSISCRPGSAV
jgi:hypothetical protein